MSLKCEVIKWIFLFNMSHGNERNVKRYNSRSLMVLKVFICYIKQSNPKFHMNKKYCPEMDIIQIKMIPV